MRPCLHHNNTTIQVGYDATFEENSEATKQVKTSVLGCLLIPQSKKTAQSA